MYLLIFGSKNTVTHAFIIFSGWECMNDLNYGEMPGVLMSGGTYWKEQRRFLLRYLRDFGFGKSSMESLITEEMEKLCKKLSLESMVC